MVYYLNPNNGNYNLAVNMQNAKENYLVWAIPAAAFFVVLALIMVAKPAMFCDKDEKGNVVCVNKLKAFVAALVGAGAGLAFVQFGLPESAAPAS
jgi:hypothetical protein